MATGINTYTYAATVETGAWLIPVPEPETWALFATGAMMLVARKRLGKSRHKRGAAAIGKA